ncbi:MAG: hypothetical protein ACXWCM_02595 [Acidimicrobiales bacterium]
MSLDPDRRRAALAAKLGALVAGRWPTDPATAERESSTNAAGATLREGSTGWVLLDERPERGLGAALGWARQQQVDDLHVLADDEAGVLARRAAEFARAPRVWSIQGRDLTEASLAPFPPAVALAPEADAAAELLRGAGIDVVIEHGVVVGEVEGLEVARVVVDERGARVQVGVGRHDREAFAMLHGEVPTPEALASVIETVRGFRRAGAAPHPLNRLGAERWLRSRVIADPSIVGATDLVAVEGTLAREGVKDVVPAAAVGTGVDGAPVVAVASVGIDLDLVPTAADVRARYAPGARLVLVLPERDALATTRALAAALAEPAEIVTRPGDWRA